jgi:hypothetical protein
MDISNQINKIVKSKFALLILLCILFWPGVVVSQTYTVELDSAYHMLDRKDVKGAIPLFEAHIKQYPMDTQIWTQLAYIYDEQGQYSKSYQYFRYVSINSKDPKEKEGAEVSAQVMKDKMNANAKRSIDISVTSYYDTYQKNYITGLTAYYKFRLSPEVFVGPYLDVYTDSKSAPGNILNDRYIELGLFGRFYALPNLYLELRTGWVHEFDIDTSKISVSPRIVYGTRFGSALDYITANPTTKTGIFMDLYAVASYETKYDNSFLQVGLTEAFRNNIKGYSYLDFYTLQNLTLDSRRLDYNNDLEVGAGVRYKPNLIYFPLFFIEPTYKFYLIKDALGNKRTPTFQVKIGFSFGISLKG